MRVRELTVLLSVIAGSTDVITFIRLNGLFSAHVTGNIVILAARIVARNPAIASGIASVPVFIAVLLAASVLVQLFDRARLPTLQIMLLLQCIFLAASAGVGVLYGPWANANAPLAVLAGMLAVAAMAMQNALIAGVLTSSPSTAVMTTNLSRLMISVGALLVAGSAAAKDAQRARIGHLAPAVAGFVGGAALGAALQVSYGIGALFAPVVLALIAVIFARSPDTLAAASSQ